MNPSVTLLAALFDETAQQAEAIGLSPRRRTEQGIRAVLEALGVEPAAERAPAAVRALATYAQRDLATRVRPVVEAVAALRGFTAADLIGRSRLSRFSLARHEASWVLRTVVGLSFPSVGAAMGGRDHSTVLAGVRIVAEAVARDPKRAALLRTVGLRAMGSAAVADGERSAA